MEQNFQTSFIPKKPIIEERAVVARPVSFFLVISIFILSTVLVVTAGLYFYSRATGKNITVLKDNLDKAKNRFEPTRINQLQILDKRLKASTEILSKHIAISPIFEALQAITMKTVKFTKFNYSMAEDSAGKLMVQMSGVAVGYRSVALQSDLFTKFKYFIDPIFSNLSLDNSGNVLFDLEFSVDPTFVNYKNVLLRGENDVLDTTLPIMSN